ncbi:MAG: VanZ family protein [Oscillospiraceae bacterium]|jgi:glycopeptide antibiotics resistance protein|nr:VanZ family protein [Oscillospiraceae bacterium]
MAKKRLFAHPVAFTLFILYMLAILFLLVVPNNYRSHNVLIGGLTWERWSAYVTGGFNLIPFRGIAEQISFIFSGEDVVRNAIYLAGNLVGFAPLGFFLPILFKKQVQYKVFIITVVSALICLELAQLMTMRGSFDIDDIILNTAGACLGFLVLRKVVKRVVAGINGQNHETEQQEN